jgi:N-methylhydantoinase A
MPLVPRELRFEAPERVTSDGEVLRDLSASAIAKLVEAVGKSKPDACAVCLLFSFINPEHEGESETDSRQRSRHVPVDLIRGAAGIPRIRAPVDDCAQRLPAAGVDTLSEQSCRCHRQVAPRAALGINQSSGGLMSVDQARRFPIRTALSGPAAGAVGAIHTARLSGIPDVIALDMGGTSADVCLIRNYEAGTTFNKWIEGYPARLPAVDINAVGAGGGSIGWFDRDGLLKVGPQSAGALPGPACYAGAEAKRRRFRTPIWCSDGWPPRGLLGGEMALKAELARAAVRPLAARLGFLDRADCTRHDRHSRSQHGACHTRCFR